ncbi:MAG: hypothetical protein ACYTG7_13290 [Planctomycetota bacterium]
MYVLNIKNTRNLSSSTLLYNYIDNISIDPQVTDFGTDRLNVTCQAGCQVNFDVDAGAAYAGEPYWIWLSASGTFPGFDLSGITVPLNQDILFLLGLDPAFAGAVGFIGNLDVSGSASAALMFPADTREELVGIPIHFAYVVTSAGPSLPIKFASCNVHVKYIP